MNARELRQKDMDDLKKMLAEERKGLSNLRFRSAVSEIENCAQFGKSRRQIARILTLLAQRERAGKPEGAAPARPKQTGSGRQ